MELPTLIINYDLERFKEHILAINTQNINKGPIEIKDLDSEPIFITKENFIDNINDIYKYYYKTSLITEFFSLLGKLNGGKYFIYNYHHLTNILQNYNLMDFEIEVLISSNLEKLIDYDMEPSEYEDFVALKPTHKIP